MTTHVERTSFTNNFNKLLLIKLVRARPAVWDTTNDNYRNKLMKRAAWHEICRIMKKDYDKLNRTERQKYYRWIIKVWRHTRNCWSKSLNARKIAKKFGITMIPYKYDTEMAFLKNVIHGTKKTATEEDEMDAEDEEEAQNKGNNEESGSNSVSFRRNVNEFNDDNTDDDWTIDSEEGIVTTKIHDRTINKIDNTSKNNNMTEDLIDAKITAYLSQMQIIKETNDILEDRHFAFFKGVHPSLISLDDDQTLEFQSSVINLLRNIKRGGSLNKVASDEPFSCSSSSGDSFMQPEAQVVSQQLIKAPIEVQNTSSGSAASKRTQLKVITHYT